ncbi:MoxR family ATPase [Actinocrispum sp. NPDC049592]|uniref:AAA family ATPase n=1 Tax=Actinocrispum sp. NPDC049592 TaxID=3154835 RepID=UPI00343E7833
MTDQDQWYIYRGDSEPHDGIAALPDPPPWRTFSRPAGPGERVWADTTAIDGHGPANHPVVYLPDRDVVELVNAALYLRRPLLVTGKPGTGKSTLAHDVARELKLGPVLYWPITSSSNLKEALYQYDAIGRLQEASLHRSAEPPDVGKYIRLGPLGTALLPWPRPRVLLIDELDKSDIDLPNDLLNIFEEGRFDIPELTRLPDDQARISVMTEDADVSQTVVGGRVQCAAFPFVVITSNGEREFPPPFLRRCVRLSIQPPDAGKLAKIVAGHLGPAASTDSERLIERFLSTRDRGDLATDQLLNAFYLAGAGTRPADDIRQRLYTALFQPLDSSARQE